MNVKEVLITAALGFLGAASADLSSFRKTLQSDPGASFDWKLAAWRRAQGAAVAALMGGGSIHAGD